MANTFQAVISGSFDGELIYNLNSYAVPDTVKKYIESVEIAHREKFTMKRTGFETIKYQKAITSGASVFVDLNIMFTGDLPRPFFQQLCQLAQGINGGGMELYFRDDWISSFLYTCRWVNAGDFVASNEVQYGANMALEAWSMSAI